ncbi:DNA polymerase III subunit gamma/tau [Microbacterium fluvii]|uniref:DNA polymerase III subunit gamma/tau n=1 Tax=Microbacterium fluvii TaxID=415215 RepID=A0ABW2HEY2_9MICO|nr:DNA polymerase III subunit gamma/tau [Microbacterium fluvii]MCU4672151.1 DNA polymerase III subunit gamma/tau [Microbacterium fluvii]
MPREDDDALTWDGDDDPTLDAGVDDAPAPSRLPAGYTAVGKGSEALDAAVAPAQDSPATASTVDITGEPAPLGNVALVTFGVLGGIHLLYAVGWFVGGQSLNLVAQLFLEPAGFTAAWLLASLAPLVWFATTLVLTRGAAVWKRMLPLIVGVVVLIPWPFLMAGVR